MNIILLSGGSGKRLWPLSNDIRSKQFIKLFKTEQSGYESMIQRIYRTSKTCRRRCGSYYCNCKISGFFYYKSIG